MNKSLMKMEVRDPEKVKKSIEGSLQGNERVNISLKAENRLEITLEAEDMTSFRGSLNSVLRLTKLANKIIS